MRNFLSVLVAATAVTAGIIPENFGNAWENSGKFQGDIAISPAQSRNGLPVSYGRVWPAKTLVIKYDSTLTSTERTNVNTALAEISRRTGGCIKYRLATSTDIDYVLFTNKFSGCYSYVGKIGGEQVLNLQNPGCTTQGTIIHESVHALGFYHMQSDPSRDNFVNIYLANVRSGSEHNFDKMNYLTSYGETYDLDSIMHYSRYAFSTNGQPTIESKGNPTYPIGKRELSAKDVNKLRKMYQC